MTNIILTKDMRKILRKLHKKELAEWQLQKKLIRKQPYLSRDIKTLCDCNYIEEIGKHTAPQPHKFRTTGQGWAAYQYDAMYRRSFRISIIACIIAIGSFFTSLATLMVSIHLT